MRGTTSLVNELRGFDKVHLCRNHTCGEDGQHFKTFGLAKQFNPERFQLQLAAAGARDAGQTMWSWIWKGSQKVGHKLADFGSESEAEDVVCSAYKVRWSNNQGEELLSDRPCKCAATEHVALLIEDQYGQDDSVVLCPTHASKYLSKRMSDKCSMVGCRRVGCSSNGGIRVCAHHETEQQTPSARPSRSRSRERRPSFQHDEGGNRSSMPEDEGDKGRVRGEEMQTLLDEIRELKSAIPPKEPAEESGRKRRLSSRSPGTTPKSSVHRSLAKLGMLDSPDVDDKPNWLEEFFERYMDGKPLNIGEDQVRKGMCEKYGVSMMEMARALHGLASIEQSKGQKGLTKFLNKWRADFEEVEEPSFSSEGVPSRSWSVVSESPPKVVEPPGLGAQVRDGGGPPMRIAAPGVFGRTKVEDRKAGAAASGGDSMATLAQAIQHQTAELASLVKAQHENGQHPAGTMRGLNRQSEELVFLARACDQYHVAVCPGEVGAGLANGLLSAQSGAATKLRGLGFRQKVTTRLAIGIAGPYWGAHEKHTLSAADFIHYSDAELDAFTLDKQAKSGSEQRPAQPTRVEDWESRVRRQNEIWKLVYGTEWGEVREFALTTLVKWHHGSPHQWPLNVIMDVWEELHWRFFEELKDLLRSLKREAKRETLSLQEIRFYALLPGPDGQAWLALPSTFDVTNPEGWFKTELEPRIARKQDRTLWRLTWEGGRPRSNPQLAGAAGGAANAEKEMKPKLLGPKLSQEEVNRARDRAPVDDKGTLLCWSHLTHQGCGISNCQRAHKPLKGQFEQLDPCVRMQLVRRGGLKRMRAETKESAEEKIKQFRAEIAKDRAEKTGKPTRRAGDGTTNQGEAETVAEEAGASKAGGEQRVRFWDVPEEFEVDYTKQEDLQHLVRGPNSEWGVPANHQNRAHGEGHEKAPQEAVELVHRAKELSNGPTLRALEDTSDDLYSWAATRVARNPEVTAEELLEEMTAYGASDLAAEAAEVLSTMKVSQRAGESARLVVKDTIWTRDEPGFGSFELDGESWKTWDYQEEVPMTEELASLLQQVEPVEEKRQCVTKTLAVGLLWRKLHRRPSMAEVQTCAQEVRITQTRLALEALTQMGPAEEFVTPVEHEIRTYAHDILQPNHERDFRSLAVFPVEELQDVKVVVLRADYRGRLVVESVTGASWAPGGCLLWALIWKGHMVYIQPPEGLEADAWIAAEEVFSTPSLGFQFYWHARHDQEPSAPGKVACRLCKPTRRSGTQGEACLRRFSSLAAVAAVAGSKDHGAIKRAVRGETEQQGLCFRELFAGKGTLTTQWRAIGGRALEPVEVYEEPHTGGGYRVEHDLLREEVRQAHLRRAREGPENVGWLASPCTSFCDWQLQNGGTRSFQQPEGTSHRSQKEADRNTLSNFAAEYFETMLDNGGFPVAESTGASGRYPKQWNLPSWKKVLARPDVDYMEFRMCAFGLGPPDDMTAFYQHLTRVVFPAHLPFREALNRRCPGVSPQHRHVALKGSRPGVLVTRCTEAGVYCQQFVATVCAVLQETLEVMVGGVKLTKVVQPRETLRAGGFPVAEEEEEAEGTEDAEAEGTEDAEAEGTEGAEVAEGTEDARAEGAEGAEVAAEVTEAEMESAEVEERRATEDNPGRDEEVERLASEEAAGEETTESGAMSEEVNLNENGVEEGRIEEDAPSEGSSKWWTPTDFYSNLPYQRDGIWAEEETDLANEIPEQVDYLAIGYPNDVWRARRQAGRQSEASRAGGQDGEVSHDPDEAVSAAVAGTDLWKISGDRAFVTVYHHLARRKLFVPSGIGFTIPPQEFRNERYTVCTQVGTERQVAFEDNWRERGEANPEIGFWTGRTILVFQGKELPWVTYSATYDRGDDNENMDDDFPGEEDPSEGGEEETPLTVYRSSSLSGVGSGRSRSRSRTRRSGGREEHQLAGEYVDLLSSLGDPTAEEWAKVLVAGNRLLKEAGSVEEAARWLWSARQEKGLDNLKGVEEPVLEGILHPDLLAYLRSVHKNGMQARHVGERKRVTAGLHPKAKQSVDQVYKQIWKDVKKNRVLVVAQDNPALRGTVSSPFEAVDKMMPDRSISAEKRIVHDQRGVNQFTDKVWHPPALQPTHDQIARRILWMQTRYPGVPVLLAKKDIAGAFRCG